MCYVSRAFFHSLHTSIAASYHTTPTCTLKETFVIRTVMERFKKHTVAPNQLAVHTPMWRVEMSRYIRRKSAKRGEHKRDKSKMIASNVHHADFVAPCFLPQVFVLTRTNNIEIP